MAKRIAKTLMPLLDNIQTACNSQLSTHPEEAGNEAVNEVLNAVNAERDRLIVGQLGILRGMDAKSLADVRGKGKLPDNIPSDLVPFLISTLQQVAPAKDDAEGTMTQQEDPKNASGKSMSLQHIYERPKGNDQKLRVVRFVKSSKLNGGFVFKAATYSVTAGGYVTYRDAQDKVLKKDLKKSREQGSEEIRKTMVASLASTLNAATWCYDGPHKEDISKDPTMLMNEDSPGQESPLKNGFDAEAYPYLIATEFILVVYDENTSAIVDVKMFSDCLAAWNGQDRKTSRKPDNALV